MTTSVEWSRLTKNQKRIIVNYQQEFPIKIGSLAKELGVEVKKSTLPAGISGEIKEISGRVIARINRHDVKERQRFTIAHEVAHYLLHRSKVGGGIVDDVLYRSALSDELEAEANRLAADIIMPWGLIKKSLEYLGGKKTESNIELVAVEAEVSVTAMKIRLGKL